MKSMSLCLLAVLAVGAMTGAVDAQVLQANSAAWIGINVQTLDRSTARSRNLNVTEGALITNVVANSPAERAGLRIGDVIVRFEGSGVDEAGDIVRIADRYNPGDRVAITVVRNNQRLQIPLTFGDIRDAQRNPAARSNDDYGRSPNDKPNNNRTGDPDRPVDRNRGMGTNRGTWGNEQGPFIGVRLEELSPQMAEYFGVTRGQGALVSEVASGSPAERAGLRAGDVIVAVDDRTIRDAQEAQQFIQSRGTGSTVAIQVIRDRRPVNFSVRLTDWNNQDTWGGSDTRDPDQGFGRGETSDPESLRQEVEELREQVEDLQQQVRDLERRVDG